MRQGDDRRYVRFWGPDPLRDVEDELAFHLDMKRAEMLAAGVPVAEIEEQLRREFGDPMRIEEELKRIGVQRLARTRRASVVDELTVDMRHAWRSFRRRPAVPAVVVGTMALAIGAGTAVFSLFDAVVLNPLPVESPSELVLLRENDALGFSYPMSRWMRERGTTVDGLAGFTTTSVAVRGNDEAEQVSAGLVTGEYFNVLGLRPQVGRLLQPADEAAPGSTPHVVLSDALWRRRFGGDPDVIGRSISINEQPVTVVGVAARHFRGTSLTAPADLWIPVTMVQTFARSGLYAAPNILTTWSFSMLEHVGRIPEDGSVDRIEAELTSLHAAGLATAPPPEFAFGDEPDEAVRVTAVPLTEAAAARSREDLLRFLMVLVAVVSITLAVACVNVANLMLMRATERQRELSIRAAVGASGARVTRQLLVESAVLAIVAGLLGIVVAMISMRLVGAFSLPGGIPIAEVPLTLNRRMLLFTGGVAAVCAVLFGVAPATLGARTAVMDSMRGPAENSPQRRWRGGFPLLAAQVALCVVLLVAGSLFVHSLRNALGVDLGFRTNGVATLSVALRQHGYTGDQAAALMRELEEQASARPDMEGFAAATRVPIEGQALRFPMHSTDAADRSASPRIAVVQVTPGFLDLLQVELQRGRSIEWADRDKAPQVAVVSARAAELLWPGVDPIGRQFVPMFGAPFNVVGVTEDVHFTRLSDREPQIYLPLLQTWNLGGLDRLQLVGAGADAGAVLAALKTMVHETDSRLPVFAERSITQQVHMIVAPQRFGSVLLAAFGAIALLISAVGIYAVAAYEVARRNRELGIRAALGAQRRELVNTVIAPAAIAICGGTVAGLLVSASATRALRSMLFGITPYEPLSYLAPVVLLGLVAILASWLPARRAAGADPLEVIRS